MGELRELDMFSLEKGWPRMKTLSLCSSISKVSEERMETPFLLGITWKDEG